MGSSQLMRIFFAHRGDTICALVEGCVNRSECKSAHYSRCTRNPATQTKPNVRGGNKI